MSERERELSAKTKGKNASAKSVGYSRSRRSGRMGRSRAKFSRAAPSRKFRREKKREKKEGKEEEKKLTIGARFLPAISRQSKPVLAACNGSHLTPVSTFDSEWRHRALAETTLTKLKVTHSFLMAIETGARSSFPGPEVAGRMAPHGMEAFHSAFHLFARQAAMLPLDLSPANFQNSNHFTRSSLWDATTASIAANGKASQAFHGELPAHCFHIT